MHDLLKSMLNTFPLSLTRLFLDLTMDNTVGVLYENDYLQMFIMKYSLTHGKQNTYFVSHVLMNISVLKWMHNFE